MMDYIPFSRDIQQQVIKKNLLASVKKYNYYHLNKLTYILKQVLTVVKRYFLSILLFVKQKATSVLLSTSFPATYLYLRESMCDVGKTSAATTNANMSLWSIWRQQLNRLQDSEDSYNSTVHRTEREHFGKSVKGLLGCL